MKLKAKIYLIAEFPALKYQVTSQSLMGVDSTNNVICCNTDKHGFFRCVKCYKIIEVSANILDQNGNLVAYEFDNRHHSCFGFDIIEENDELANSRLAEELFLIMVRHKSVDKKTGHIIRTYEHHVRILYFALTPIFTLHLSHIEDKKIKQELADLDEKILDNVMRDAIGKLFECVTSERWYNLSIRNRIQWEIVD